MKALEIRKPFVHEKEIVVPVPRYFDLGWLPSIVLAGSLGVLEVALAFTLSLEGFAWAELLYWTGLMFVVLPVAFRLITGTSSRQERIGLVAFLGLALYLVKIIHSPQMFIYSDELLHFHNADNILQSGRLFLANSILPESAYYPGLELATTALSSLSGLSIFTAGVILIGVARLVIVLALYQFFLLFSRSGRAAALAVLIYTTNSNFLYWSAQFSYESLALPLGVLLLVALARWVYIENSDLRRGLTWLILFLTATIVITHHITTYALVGFLIAISMIYTILRKYRKNVQPNTWGFALFAMALALFWVIVMANPTIFYLFQIFKYAFNNLVQIIVEGGLGRTLFTSQSGVVAPLWERVIGIGSVILILIGTLLGWLTLYKRKQLDPLAILLALVAVLYFGILGLRFIAAGWEIANRASEFLYVGIAFVVASGLVAFRFKQSQYRLKPLILTGYVAILFMGGVIAGWSPSLRLAHPLLINVDGATLPPQGLEAARWMLDKLGPNQKIAAPSSDATLMQAYGRQYVMTGKIYSIIDLLTQPHTLDWQTDVLQKIGVRYLAVDRRRISWNSMSGQYFDSATGIVQNPDEFFPPEVAAQFDWQLKAPRIFDSGDLVIYDVGVVSGVR